MMSKILSLILLVFCIAGPVVATIWYESGRNSDVDAEILVRSPERGNFSPQKLTVTAGKPIRLRVRNVDTVMHGFAIPALGVDAGEIPAGHVALLEFTPAEPGSYDYYCTVWCSEFHLQMRGVVEVVAP
ncbi:MAG: cupredoxin domain-containing protein [Phycisphaerae bacterium]|jgi:cytochrome c oxidase subunit 2|nr:cupredoxin domain-containing protein [Phycisphaerae bacterium]